ncbi:flexible cuticle protein 12-like [Sitodiplosis mosellana]|uniref:flexible cuticle protein 12-like n=1 Tax=Sitodiplosis mosellana TaxID=263140 RepID=UPI002443DD2E|nr:flexible cuticle protein 12-like [Sitodiplosis mosellana]
MSKLSLIVLSVFAVAFVAAQEPQVRNEYNNNDGSGTFEFSYELDNGQFFQEAGKLNEKGAQEVAGQYSFQGNDGQTYWVKYTADEEGFHPIVGAGPGGPDAIDPNALKSLVG